MVALFSCRWSSTSAKQTDSTLTARKRLGLRLRNRAVSMKLGRGRSKNDAERRRKLAEHSRRTNADLNSSRNTRIPKPC